MMNTPSDFQPPAAPGMVNADQRPVDVVVLFSGGLDSILAAKVLEEQGLRVCCLHCHSPFFGDPGAVERWSNLYGLDIRTLDVSDDFCAMLRARPAHGFGKVMNPCVDCKILLLRHARLYMESIGARLLATGEVMGQRPMSQRRDVLNAIRRDAGVQDILLRPLSALHLAPTPAEEEGFVDRSRLLGISGRGRKDQLELAKKYQLPEIPTPGGGCRLADKENARRYWPVLSRWSPTRGPSNSPIWGGSSGRSRTAGTTGWPSAAPVPTTRPCTRYWARTMPRSTWPTSPVRWPWPAGAVHGRKRCCVRRRP